MCERGIEKERERERGGGGKEGLRCTKAWERDFAYIDRFRS